MSDIKNRSKILATLKSIEIFDNNISRHNSYAINPFKYKANMENSAYPNKYDQQQSILNFKKELLAFKVNNPSRELDTFIYPSKEFKQQKVLRVLSSGSGYVLKWQRKNKSTLYKKITLKH